MPTDILVTVLSWEDRYILGLEKNLSEYEPTTVIVFKKNTPLTTEWKKENLQKTKDLVKNNLKMIEIDANRPDEIWVDFRNTFAEYCNNKRVVVDITTMNRESIWLSLFNCKLNNCETDYIYYKPEEYSQDWISRDPGKPRLLYKMSGIAKLGAPSLLLITGGYDIQRLDNLIYHFDPKQTMLFFQDGDDHRNVDNFKDCQELFRTKYHIELLYEYDAYDIGSSYDLILGKLLEKEEGSSETFLDSYNIILNSLGAKTSAITLFNLWLKYPCFALSYIPSREYNKEYSKGIGDSYSGKIPF